LLNLSEETLTKAYISDNIDSSRLMHNKGIFSWPTTSLRGRHISSAYQHLSISVCYRPHSLSPQCLDANLRTSSSVMSEFAGNTTKPGLASFAEMKRTLHYLMQCTVVIYWVCKIKRNKYVSGDWPISTHADPTSTRRSTFLERRISSVTFLSVHLYGNVYIRVGVARALAANSSDFGRLGSKVYKNLWFPALDADEPPSKMWRH